MHIWFYVEVFDPFGVEFLAGMHNYGSIYILLHADIESEQHQLLKMLYVLIIKNQVSIGVWIYQFDSIDQCVNVCARITFLLL